MYYVNLRYVTYFLICCTISESCCISILSVFESCSLVIERTLAWILLSLVKDTWWQFVTSREAVSFPICLLLSKKDVGFDIHWVYCSYLHLARSCKMHLPFFFPPPLDMKTSDSLHTKFRMCLKNYIKKNILCSVFFVSTMILFCSRILYFWESLFLLPTDFPVTKQKHRQKCSFRRKLLRKWKNWDIKYTLLLC